jgi:hypothetical protein
MAYFVRATKIPIVNIEPITLRNRAEEAAASDTWYWTASTIKIGITGMAVVKVKTIEPVRSEWSVPWG